MQINPKILYIYQTAYIKNLETKNKQDDSFAWLLGVYITESIGACFSKRGKYPKAPHGNKTDSIDKPLTDAERFEMWAKSFNKNKGLQ